jgi:hypothetical protein
MNEYELHVNLVVKVEAFDLADAIDAVHDAFGEGSTCGVDIKSFKVDKNYGERPERRQG